jgi:hypothetical protein
MIYYHITNTPLTLGYNINYNYRHIKIFIYNPLKFKIATLIVGKGKTKKNFCFIPSNDILVISWRIIKG